MPKVPEFEENAKTVLEALNNEFIHEMNDAILKGNVTAKSKHRDSTNDSRGCLQI